MLFFLRFFYFAAGKDPNKSLDQKMPPGRPLTGMRTQNQQPQQQQQSQPPQQQQQPPNHWNNQFQPLKQHGNLFPINYLNL